MKVHLLFPDRDPDTEPDARGSLPCNGEALTRDLGLDTLFEQMAAGDAFLRDVAARTILNPVQSVSDVRWRQAVLADCLRHPQAARSMYQIAVDGLDSQKKIRGWFLGRSPTSVLTQSVEKLQALVEPLKALRQFADVHDGQFRSQGWRDLLAMIHGELSDDYFVVLEDHLQRLRFPTGVVMTATLGPGCRSDHYVLRRPRSVARTWRDLLGLGRPGELTYRLPDRDQAGAQALDELRDRGINLVADAAAQSVDHVLGFFAALRWELAFYLGCLNLHDRLDAAGLPTCFPTPSESADHRLGATGLYDVGLGLRIGARVVGNDLDADGRALVLVTGANQGGKSTLLRSVGLAQLMMQAGMFTGARSLRASIVRRVHTHYRREEDISMHSGKLDEELARMSDIVDDAAPNDLVLFNESFASTNEREGSQIARHILDALTDAGIRVVFVTHMFDLARGLAQSGSPKPLFLRPERLDDGRRTFTIIEGPPTATSNAQDIYEQVFGRR